ncbi:hypothetical protein [uncultured Acetatifactor sp.]|nr:hypothetical protein [uncultured Acetatifactor sp.]
MGKNSKPPGRGAEAAKLVEKEENQKPPGRGTEAERPVETGENQAENPT